MKKETIKEIIIAYAKNKNYFHISDLKEYFKNKQIRFKEDTLKKDIQRLKKVEIIYEAGRGWYSTIKRTFLLNTKPVEKIVALIKKKFPFLEFSCWSTEQLISFYHHILSQFVTFVYAEKDMLQSLKDFLTDNNYNVFLNPHRSEVDKYVELKNRTVILRLSVFSRESKKEPLAKIERILVDLFIETKKINLIDIEEYKKVFSDIVLNYRINIAKMLDYAYSRKIKNTILNIIRNFRNPLM